MRKFLIPLAALALGGLAILYVLAQVVQNDSTTGSVTVVGDVLTVSPDTDWLTVLSFGSAADSGVQELVFTNPQTFDADVTVITVTQTPPVPNAFNGSMTLTMGEKVGTCPSPLPLSLNLDVGQRAVGFTVPAGSTMTICGQLDYSGVLGPVDDAVALDFVFDTEPVTP